MLHADFGFPIKVFDLVDQLRNGGLGVRDVTGRHKDHVAGSADGDSDFAFGNINTNSVHKRYSFEMNCNGQNQFYSLPVQSTGDHTNTSRFNLHKTNAANEELVIRLVHGRRVQENDRYTIAPSLYSLSNKMDNSLLAVRDINSKYIVAGKDGETSKIKGEPAR